MPAQGTPQPWWANWSLSYSKDVYGPIYGGHSIQEAAYNTLQKWLPAYIHEFNRTLGGDILKVPTEYRYQPDERTLPRSVEAAILVICGGTAGAPQTHQHTTRSVWNMQTSVFVFGTSDWQETEALTYAYGAAVRAAIIQHGSLGKFAETTQWVGEKYLKGTRSSTRQAGLAIIDFQVHLAQTIDTMGGPPTPGYAAQGIATEPTTNPPGPIPIATEADITVEETR